MCRTIKFAATVFLLATIADVSTTTVSAQETRPNLVVILADDLGYGDLACCGASDMRTPVLDRFFASGMTFRNFSANCPVCSPTRAALLSGRYPDLVGVPGVIRTHAENSWGYLSPEIELLPQAALRAGYTTGMVGKWHLGLESPNTPTERGFQDFRGYLGDMMDDYYKHRRHGINYMYHGTRQVDPAGHATDLFGQWAVDYLNRVHKSEQPFLLYLAFNAPHSPIQPPDEWLKKVQQRESGITTKRAKLVALIEHMDHTIGRVLQALSDNGQADNTIVVFTSDNGGALNHGATNGSLRDGKGSVYEGGLKVPTAVVWPGHIAPGSQTDFRALSMDILPTLFDAANISTDLSAIEGRSFLPALLENNQLPLREYTFFVRREGGFQYGGKCVDAVLTGPWKLLQNSPFSPRELYNLNDDPQEKNNLIRQHPQVAHRLNAAMRRQLQQAGSVPWQPPIR